MNKDTAKGSIQKTAGKAQRKVGEMLGSEEQQYEGSKKEVKGSKNKTVGKVKDAFK